MHLQQSTIVCTYNSTLPNPAAHLAHEPGDDAMEGGALESKALLSGAQGTEVLYRRCVCVTVESQYGKERPWEGQ